jgi:hypothetical protein
MQVLFGDTFRWRPKVTFNAGFRWDYFGVREKERKRFSKFNPAVSTAPGFVRSRDAQRAQ